MDFMKTRRPIKYDILLPVLFSGGNRVFGVPDEIQSAGYTKHTKKIHPPGQSSEYPEAPL
jgi:hypothetical protein